jgi:phosphatidylethanolamine-binding protein (PEBP) family uncharacterized protein
MKITVTNEEVKFLANIVIDQAAPTPKEPDVGWRSWVTAPIAQHAINPGEAKAILTVIGILADYGIPIRDILKTTLENFVENYATPCPPLKVWP